MLRGFTPWQKRITVVGVLGASLSVVGAIVPWRVLMMSGVALSICSLYALLLLSYRQGSRQLERLKVAHPPVAGQSTQPQNMRSKTFAPAIGVAHEYGRRIEKNVSGYEAFALRSRSLTIRDSFAIAATNGDYGYRELVQLVAVQRMKILPELKRRDLKDWQPAPFLALARVLANQRSCEDDLENAVRMFSFAEAFFGRKILDRHDRLINLESLGELGRFEQQQALAGRFKIGTLYPIQLALINLNHVRARQGINSTAWLQGLNTLYQEHGYSPVTYEAQSDLVALDSLGTDVSATHSGPRVSIIVPTYQGGSHLISALKSLLNQSWQNLEIIVVDDGSGHKFESYLERAAALSPKIQILKHERNMGAYHARNTGLRAASGEYITIHDDDDWSHGDKIATQVIRLLNNTNAVATMSSHVRVTDGLQFLRINNNPTFSQANYSSLMFPKKIIDEIGPWDEVNRGGDAEFRDRIVSYYGKRIDVIKEVPLSFTRTWEGSLTSGEISRGFLDTNRRLYATAYAQWHQKAGKDLKLLRPATPRKFPIPSSMAPGPRDKDLGTFDIVFMTDYRFPGGTTSLTLQEIEASVKAGYRVGFIHAESPLNGTHPPVSERLFELQLAGKVQQVGLQDKALIRLLIIRHPSVVTFMDQTESELQVGQVILIVNNPPVLVGGHGMVFDLQESLSNVDRIFGHQSILLPESGVTRNLCSGLVPEKRLHPENWPGLVEPQPYKTPDFGKRPVLGRHSRDHKLKWPSSRADFDAIYTSSTYDTVFLGGANSLIEKLGTGSVQNKTVHEFGAVEVKTFLEDIDFWAYYHDETLTESFGMAIAEALAAGKVVILPPYLEASFGDGALYANPSDVEDLVNEMWGDPDRYVIQSKRAIQYVEENISVHAFLNRLHSFIAAAPSSGQTLSPPSQ